MNAHYEKIRHHKDLLGALGCELRDGFREARLSQL